MKPRRVIEFCNKISTNNLKIYWRCTAKVQTVTSEMLFYMKNAGCKLIAYGVESGDQQVLDLIRKRQTLDEVKFAFDITKKAGLMTFALCMVGNIGEDFASVKKTGHFVSKLNPDLASSTIMIPYPGTENYEICKKNKWIYHYKWDEWVATPINIGKFSPVTKTDRMDRRTILKAYYYLNKHFFVSKLIRKYGAAFFINPIFYYNEILKRVRHTGLSGLMKHLLYLIKQ